MTQDHLYDVIVIGAGIAGLTAAHLLLKSRPDLDVLVVEAKQRAGGRVLSKSVACADGESRQWCFGGAWVSRSQKHLLGLLGELGIETFNQHNTGIKIVEMDGNVTQYEGGVPTIGLLNLLDMDWTLRSLERNAASLKSSTPEALAKMDQESVRDTVKRMTFRQDSEVFLLSVVAPVLQGSEDKMSQIHALNVAQSSGGFEKLFKDAQELRIDGGAQSLTDRLAGNVGRDRIQLNWPVAEVTQSDDGVVRVVSDAGDQLACRFLLCTLPLAALRHVRFRPELQHTKQRLAESCPGFSTTLKIVITYATPFWRVDGFSGEILSCREKPTTEAAGSLISVCYDASSRDGSQAALVVLASNDVERPVDQEERKTAVLDHLARFYPRSKVLNFVDYVEHSWRSEPFNTTCMASAAPVGCGCLLLDPELRKPLGRVHFAGSDLATEWIGYMEGAVQSAKLAVDEILQTLAQN